MAVPRARARARARARIWRRIAGRRRHRRRQIPGSRSRPRARLGLRHRLLLRDLLRRAIAERLDPAHDEQLFRLHAARQLHAALRRVHAGLDDGRVRDVLVVDDVDDVALLRRLDRQAGHDDALARIADRHGALAERAGPQPVLVRGLVDLRGHADEPGRRIRRAVDERDLRAELVRALAQLDRRGHPGLQARRILLADLEAKQQRIALEDRREHRTGLEVLALLHGAGLDDAGDRRAYRRVAQVEVRDRARLVRGIDIGLRGIDRGLLLLDLLARDEAGRFLLRLAPAVARGLGGLLRRLRLRERAPGLRA